MTQKVSCNCPTLKMIIFFYLHFVKGTCEKFSVLFNCYIYRAFDIYFSIFFHLTSLQILSVFFLLLILLYLLIQIADYNFKVILRFQIYNYIEYLKLLSTIDIFRKNNISRLRKKTILFEIVLGALLSTLHPKFYTFVLSPKGIRIKTVIYF